MKISIEMSEKEAVELVTLLRTRQKEHNDMIKLAVKQTLSHFCDDFGLHDEELDAALDQLTKA